MPLWTPQTLHRNPLEYPAGVAPGFDPSHVAAAGTRFSAIANAKAFLNLFTGGIGTNLGAVGGSIDGAIGPATKVQNFGGGYVFSGQSTAIDASATCGAIVRLVSVTAAEIFSTSGTTSGGYYFNLDSSGNMRVVFNNVVTKVSSLALTTNVPYFLAWSVSGSGINYVALRLDTGVLVTGTSGSSTPLAPDGTYQIGNKTSSSSSLFSAFMFSSKYLSMPQLIQWAADPWSFWYPAANDNDQFSDWVGASSLAYTLSITTGAYAVGGNTVGLTVARKLVPVTGAYAIAGNTVGLAVAHKLAPATGAYVIGGNAIGLAAGRKLPITAGAYAITGNSISFSYSRGIQPVTGVYTITGNGISLTYSGFTPPLAAHCLPFFVTVGQLKSF